MTNDFHYFSACKFYNDYRDGNIISYIRCFFPNVVYRTNFKNMFTAGIIAEPGIKFREDVATLALKNGYQLIDVKPDMGLIVYIFKRI